VVIFLPAAPAISARKTDKVDGLRVLLAIYADDVQRYMA
tara:strand:- start:90 stop:206 length:117 start_codon:yes stop_codon:yes gene_type:complete